MKRYTVYTDGSFGDNGETHGGIVYWGDNDAPASCIHVYSKNSKFVSMRNVGGEIIAAWTAIFSIVDKVKRLNEECMDTYELQLVYDYEGVGKWLTGVWKTNKVATQWFVKSIKDLMSTVPNLKIKFIWVRGHSSTLGNNYADKVAAYNMAYCRNNNIPICNLDEIVNI